MVVSQPSDVAFKGFVYQIVAEGQQAILVMESFDDAKVYLDRHMKGINALILPIAVFAMK